MDHTKILMIECNRILAQRLSQKAGQLVKAIAAINRELAQALIARESPFDNFPGLREIQTIRREKAAIEEELSDTMLIIQELRRVRKQMIRAEQAPTLQ